ncbi:MAG: acyltransferase [Planctomycetes bacterium]|nr:acyltransferase [Planctomycetota bacterium]
MPPRHLPVLDGLRAIAVLLVLWNHVPKAVPGYPEALKVADMLVGPGGFGVELFFVLSGFLITRILIGERERHVPVRWFLARRFLRIFPIYYLLLLVLLPFRPAAEIGWCAAYLYNLKSILWGAGGPLAHTWSLCIEEHFYLLWPLAVAFLPRGCAPRLLVFVVLPAAVGGAWLVCELVDGERALTAVQHGSPFRFLTLGTGSLLAFAEGRLLAAPRRAAALGLGLVAVGVALHPWFLFLGPMLREAPPLVDLRLGPLAWLLQSGSLATGLVLLAVLLGEAWPRNPLAAAPLRAIGRISYALYLYHYPLFHYVLHPAPTAANTAIAVTATFAAATASWYALERPLLRIAARFRGRGAGGPAG